MKFKQPSFALGSAVATIGAAVLVGWILDVAALKSLHPNLVSMKANTAFCFLLLGLALSLRSIEAPSQLQNFFPKIILYGILLVAGLSLCEYLFRINTGIDQSLFKEAAGTPGTYSPGRMALTTAVGFILTAWALLILERNAALSQLLGFTAFFIAALASIGYLYGVESWIGWAVYERMALHTSLAFIFFAVGIFALSGNRGIMSDILDEGPGGFLLRRLLPFAFAVPLTLGYAHTLMQRRSPFAPGLESSLLSLLEIIVALIVIWRVGRALSALDANRRQMEIDLDASEARFRTIFESSADAIMLLDEKGFFDCNAATMRVFGCRDKQEFCSRHPAHCSPPVQPCGTESLTLANRWIGTALANGSASFDWIYKRLDSGVDFTAEVLLSRVELNGRRVLQATVRDVTVRKNAGERLAKLSRALEQSPAVVVISDATGLIEYVNPRFTEVTGYSFDDALGRNPRFLKSGETRPEDYRKLWETITSSDVWRGELHNKKKDGSLYWARAAISPVRGDSGKIIAFLGIQEDVTAQKILESELRQAQKMESVGRLAGGVAHDFNNILTAINGYAQFLHDAIPEGDPKRDDAKEILAAGGRAASLTRQLLAFSRKQILNPQVADLNVIVGDTVRMLKRLIGADVKVETRLAAHPCLAKLDAGQIGQVLLNLAVNARDAMPAGGTLTISTQTLRRKNGPWVALRIADTGAGMDATVKNHLFEPFFTTKERGKGTGLGLAMADGIVKQCGGEIEVESALKIGTTFHLYFPQMDISIQDKKTSVKDESPLPRGYETILLVEDEAPLRLLGERVLSGNGYTVLTAANGKEALELLEHRGKPVDLLITDVVMPGMNGRELAREVVRRKMTRRTLYISGYTDEAIVQHGVLEPGLSFLYKPFAFDALLRKLRAVLDGSTDQARA